MTDYSLAYAYVQAIAGNPETAVVDFRALHDTDKADPGHSMRSTLPQAWQWITERNAAGFGIFMVVNALDGQGRKLDNVTHIRAHFVDLDSPSAPADYERACSSIPPPAFAVQSSVGKYHIYWPVGSYAGNDRFQTQQRKMRQVFNGDPTCVDATRVMRLPGTLHMKQPQSPVLVTCHALAGWGQSLTMFQLEQAYQSVNVIDGGGGERHDLGDPALAAPSIEWLRYGLSLIDPNTLDRGEWIAITSATKQSGWTFGEDAVRAVWDEWCGRYDRNDAGENDKQWKSIRNTQLGWQSLTARVPALRAAMAFQQQQDVSPAASAAAAEPVALDGEFLSEAEQQYYFRGCVYISSIGKILTPEGRMMNTVQFNGAYGGKQFVISRAGKTTDDAWRAATRSTLWNIPKVDHLRFMPHEAHGAIVRDVLGRSGVNTYAPANVEFIAGDPSPFTNHMEHLIPDESDRAILYSFLAHNVRYPGHKIPWAPVIQSVEGAGKGVMKELMTYCMGLPYVHFPNAQDLTSSGSKFNEWMDRKLFILADEIKVDDKRDLIEILKPLISEKLIEVQAKGVDQALKDNYANWMFFTNYKDAVPVSKNGRRYAIFYSPIQTMADLYARGMNDTYFDALYGWLASGGAGIVANWLNQYPIERGKIPMRAPKTSSWDEAVKVSRTPQERVIIEAIEAGVQGFRGGWVSVQRAIDRVKDMGATRGAMPPHVVAGILESMGYVASGKAPRAWMPETLPSDLYHLGGVGDVNQYGSAQGW